MKRWIETTALVLASAGAFAQTPDTDRAKASFYLGSTLEAEGKGAEAVVQYAHAAGAGNCHAALRLGQLYERGWSGVARDLNESLQWYSQARRLGCEVPFVKPPPPVTTNGAAILANAKTWDAEGKGQDAVKAYQAAARMGHCEAALRLGEIYDKGFAGMRRDYAESLKWYYFARTLGCESPMVTAR